HREIRFAAGAREGSTNVSFLSLGILDANDEHVLGHPAFVARHVRGDAECKTLFPEQSIPTVPGTIRPNFARLREMHDVLLVVARPGNIFLSRFARHSDRVNARTQ